MSVNRKMYSFDIFDTLITRATYEPKAIFELIQKELQKQNSLNVELRESFAMLRIIAEKNLRQQSKKEEIDIYEIYEYLAQIICIEKKWVPYLVELEIKMECEHIVGIKENIENLKEKLEEGNHVILISDMYLKEEHIRKLLVSIDEIFHDITIYVSSEYRKTKSAGTLYLEVKEKENVEISNWTHVGDNYHSDYLVPRMFGIDAKCVEKKVLAAWEKNLFESAMDLELATQIELGIISTVRLNSSLSKYENLGLSLGGMILFPYVNWIIYQCQKRKIKRLYFVARDGYILKKIADRIIQYQNHNIETKYIYGSRKVWRESDGSGYVEDYLLQEVDTSDNLYAFVDLHGTGETLKNVYSILSKSQSNLILQVFYYSMFNQTDSQNVRFIVYHTCENRYMLECLCRAPHGLTIGYKKNGCKIEAIVQNVNQKLIEKSGIIDYINGVEMFIENFTPYLNNIENPYFWKKNADFLLEYISKTPCADILDFICGLPHSNTDEDVNQVYAPTLSCKDIFKIFACEPVEIERYYKGSNLEYSLLNLDKEKRVWLKLCKTFSKSFVGKYLSRKEYFSTHSRQYLDKKCKVIIYGAGKIGVQFYKELNYLHGDIVAWVDIKYEEKKKQNLPVQSLLSALDMQYDYVVIALASSKSCENVKTLLKGLNVHENKIVMIREFKKKFIQNKDMRIIK